jgi:hypothetical protein
MGQGMSTPEELADAIHDALPPKVQRFFPLVAVAQQIRVAAREARRQALEEAVTAIKDECKKQAQTTFEWCCWRDAWDVVEKLAEETK